MMTVKFRNNAGDYICIWDYETVEDLWAMVAKEEREFGSKFVQFITE